MSKHNSRWKCISSVKLLLLQPKISGWELIDLEMWHNTVVIVVEVWYHTVACIRGGRFYGETQISRGDA